MTRRISDDCAVTNLPIGTELTSQWKNFSFYFLLSKWYKTRWVLIEFYSFKTFKVEQHLMLTAHTGKLTLCITATTLHTLYITFHFFLICWWWWCWSRWSRWTAVREMTFCAWWTFWRDWKTTYSGYYLHEVSQFFLSSTVKCSLQFSCVRFLEPSIYKIVYCKVIYRFWVWHSMNNYLFFALIKGHLEHWKI